MFAIYARQSLDKKDSISIESQIDFGRKEVGFAECMVYTDKGYSGKNLNRPDFERMLRDIEGGLITKVIVYKLDRISRSVLDFCSLMETFKKHDVEFVSCSEKFDTSTPMGKAMLNIAMVFAQLERETIQQRVRDNYYERGKRGFFAGGPVPFGFSKMKTSVDGIKTSRMVMNESQGNVLQDIFCKYAYNNFSLGQLSNQLNDQKIPGPKGGLWDSGKLSRIMRNPVYVKANADVYMYYKRRGCTITNDISQFDGSYSCFLYGKREANERKYTSVKNHVLSLTLSEGFIDADVWLNCQYKLDDNRQIKNKGKGKNTWLSGLIKCGYCGYTVTVVLSNNIRYLVCRGKTNYKACDGFSVTQYVDRLESFVEKELIQWGNRLKHIRAGIVMVDNAETNRKKARLFEVEQQITNLVDQLASANNIAMAYMNKRIFELDDEKRQIQEELNRLVMTKTSNQPINNVLQCIEDWENNTFEQKKTVAWYAIKRISIKNDEIHIDWKL